MSSLVPRKLMNLEILTEYLLNIYYIYTPSSLYLYFFFLIYLYVYRIKQLFDTADFSYTLPSHRLTVYIIGIFMGYLLRYLPKDYKMNKVSSIIYNLQILM